MEYSSAPFEVGDEVVCVDIASHKANYTYKLKDVLRVGENYTVTSVYWGCCYWLVTVGISAPLPTTDCICGKPQAITDNMWPFRASRFRKINPYQSSVSRSLAEIAVDSIGDGQDMKPVKELVNS